LGVRVADDKELLAADVVFVATPPATLKGYAGIIVSAMVPGHRSAGLRMFSGSCSGRIVGNSEVNHTLEICGFVR
jgi:hypothetical protein